MSRIGHACAWHHCLRCTIHWTVLFSSDPITGADIRTQRVSLGTKQAIPIDRGHALRRVLLCVPATSVIEKSYVDCPSLLCRVNKEESHAKSPLIELFIRSLLKSEIGRRRP
jgi:predicted secreted protein